MVQTTWSVEFVLQLGWIWNMESGMSLREKGLENVKVAVEFQSCCLFSTAAVEG